MTNIVKNEKGLTLIELTISILVASILISMLLSLLTMSLKAKARIDVENKMYMESYIIAEKIKFSIFELQAQSIELISDTASETTIHINHDYDITIDPITHIISRDTSNPVTDILIYDKINEEITYNGEVLHDSNILISSGSVLELISIDPGTCDVAVQGTVCEQAIIQLTLTITIVFQNGANLEPMTLITTIIV